MQSLTKQHPPIFDSADKIQRFGISNSGEFIDSTYREQQSSKLFGKIIGRQTVCVHEKDVFTTADIVCEGYLFKKGSWVQNWKKRYFILRRDIRALCYYASREDLTLLGSIPLDHNTILTNVKPDDADGYPNVIAIESDGGDGSNTRTYIRFETFEKMKAWMLDIKNEAQNMVATSDELSDWWESLFGSTEPIKPESSVSRRNGAVDQSTIDAGRTGTPPRSNTASAASAAEKAETAQVVDSDDESDDEGKASAKDANGSVAERKRGSQTKMYVVSGASRIEKKIKHMKVEKPPGPPPFEDILADKYETPQGALSGLQFSLRLNNICAYQDRLFVVVFGSHLQETASLAQAAQAMQMAQPSTPSSAMMRRATTAGGAGASPSTGRWTPLGRTEVRVVTERPAYSESYVSDVKIFFHALQPLIPEACREIKIVVYRQENSEVPREGRTADLSHQLEIARAVIPRKLFDFRSILQIKMRVKMQLPVDIAVPLFKDAEVTLGVVKVASFSLYQHRNYLNKSLRATPYCETLYSFATNSGMTTSLEQLFASKYSTSVGQAMIALLSSERQDFLEGRILTLKEDFVKLLGYNASSPPPPPSSSPAATAVPTGVSANTTATATDSHTVASEEEKISQLYEPYRQAIESIEDVFHESNELASLILTTLDNAAQGKELKNNVLSPDVGGGVLRRSVWKKVTTWQYCTTNLNLHLMTNKFISYKDIANQVENNEDMSSYRGNITFIPTITLGCPAAHELGFSEGGLRRIFHDIPSAERKLLWMHAIQSPTIEMLTKLAQSNPKEAQALFGSKCGAMSTHEELAHTLRRKYELSRRLDICASQALGCAVMTVRTIVLLATMAGGNHFDALARALKTGFVVMFQSYLSTQGSEVGMLEDLEIAALWLSLVTVRLVTYPSSSQRSSVNDLVDLSNATESQSFESRFSVGEAPLRSSSHSSLGGDPASSPKTFRRKFAEDGKQLFTGYGDGVIIRRDMTGRLIVDVEITAQEAATVLDALNFMNQFPYHPTKVLPSTSNIPFAFSTTPPVLYSREEVPPRVYAVAELFGIVFTQGVNEMQTLANLSSSRDVLKQVDINQTSLGRLREFYAHYRLALEFQLQKRTPEMIDAIILASQTEMRMDSVSSPSSHSLSAPRGKRRGTIMGHAAQQPDDLCLNMKVEQLSAKILSYNDRLLDQLHETIIVSTSNPYEKHVDVLLRSSALCRQMCGTVATLCKSGKDRTSMGVTLENSRSLVEDLGVQNGQEICQLMRAQGVRRMNVYANTGQSMFAFNQIQRRALPACFRPPPGCHAGNVMS